MHACYFKSRKDGSTDFATRLVSNGGIYSWYEGSEEENLQLLEKAGLLSGPRTLYALPCTRAGKQEL